LGREGRYGKNKKIDKMNKKRKRGQVKKSKRWGSKWIRGEGSALCSDGADKLQINHNIVRISLVVLAPPIAAKIKRGAECPILGTNPKV